MSTEFLLVALVSTLLTWSAAAQTVATSKNAVSGSGQTSISGGGSRAQAGSSSSANVSENAGVANSPASSASANLSSGTTINAALTKSVDARRAKSGDEVTAKVTQDVKSNGKIVIAKNSRLIGHVTEAKAKEKGEANSQSSLGIVFDHAVLKNGEQMPLHVVIQALAAAPGEAAASAALDEPMGTPVSGRSPAGLTGGVGSAAGAAGSAAGDLGRTAGSVANTNAGAAASTAGNAGGALNASGQLTSHSIGVIGLSGLRLTTDAASSASVITSGSKNVKLESGTQMLLRVSGN